jgi:acetyl-CoA synthetase
LGHLPGIQFPHNFFPKEDDFFWTPADWAWMGGFMDVLLPSWHYGVPVFAHRAKKFDAEGRSFICWPNTAFETPLCRPRPLR